MAQFETTGPIPPHVMDVSRPRVESAGLGASLRTWAPRIAIAAAIITGGVLAYTLPAVKLEDGDTLNFNAVSNKLTITANGWVTTLSWFAGLLAIVAAFVFPRSERFDQWPNGSLVFPRVRCAG